MAVDLSSPSERIGLVERSRADVILHTAAVSSIEACERDPDLARELNVRAAKDLAAQARELGAQFIHVSTDAVFDGKRGGYVPTDTPSPSTEYGRTKADAEAAVLDVYPAAIVARVNFYGWSPSRSRSLAEFFYNRLSRGENAPGFTDVTVSTMYVRTLIDHLIALQGAGASGIVHAVNDQPTTKFDFGVTLSRAFGFDPGRVVRSTSSEHLSIGRGSNLTLNTDRLHEIIDVPNTTQESDLQRLAEDASSGRRTALSAFSPEEKNP